MSLLMRPKAQSTFLMIFIVLLATAARLIHIERPSLWFDEGWSAYAATQPSIIAAANADATNPPLYYVLLNMSTTFLGDSEFSLRLFSLFCSLVGIALAFGLGRQLFGERAGLYAALLVACSPLLWWASQEARMYTLLAALVLVCTLAWHRLLRRSNKRAWLALWAAELALLYTHNTGPVIVLWLNAITVISWISARRVDRPLNWRVWIGGQAIVGLLWSPYFFTRFLRLGDANSAVSSATSFTPELAVQIWQAFWQTTWERVRLAGEPPLLYIVLFAAFLIVIPWRREAARWLLLHALILITGLVVALMVLGNELHGRYLVMIAPLLLIPVGAGIARLRSQVLRWALMIPIVGLFVVNMIDAQTSDYRHDDARAMVQYYADTLDTDDTVLAWSYADRYELAYYWDRLGVRAHRVTLPEGADLDAVLPLLPQSGDVAMNVWYTQRADYRRMMACILGNGTTHEPEIYTVYGMSNLLYRQPTLNLPQLVAADVPFTHNNAPLARVTAQGQINAVTADRAQCVPLELMLERDMDVNLKAALIVQNDLGWEITRADAAFATANQQESAVLASGTTLSAYPLLQLPYGTPSGDYRVFLRVYDEVESPSGYTPPTDGTLSGRDILLGVWNVPLGAAWAADASENDLPIQVNAAVTDSLTLVAHDGSLDVPPVVANGTDIRLTLLWSGSGTLPVLTLESEDGEWQIEIPPHVDAQDRVTLEWRVIRIPADVTSGIAVLSLPDGTILARYQIEALPMLLEPPVVDVSLDTEFPAVGMLVGYNLSQPLTLSQPPVLTLVWREGEIPSETSYTVFAQLVNGQGIVVAQSDRIPAENTRPTTGWRSGEYIEDSHRLAYNDLATTGAVRLIVGMYDAATGVRVMLEDGQDFVVLAESLVIGE